MNNEVLSLLYPHQDSYSCLSVCPFTAQPVPTLSASRCHSAARVLHWSRAPAPACGSIYDWVHEGPGRGE